MFRTGIWGILYYSSNKESPKIILVILIRPLYSRFRISGFGSSKS